MSTASSLWSLEGLKTDCKMLLCGYYSFAIFVVLIVALLILFACLLIRIAKLNCHCLMLVVGSDS
jgi:hypothetical protein